jgi:hypothetical protein
MFLWSSEPKQTREQAVLRQKLLSDVQLRIFASIESLLPSQQELVASMLEEMAATQAAMLEPPIPPPDALVLPFRSAS